MKINVWFGIGDGHKLLIENSKFLKEYPDGSADIEILDRIWLDDIAWQGNLTLKIKRLQEDGWVCYDDYAWEPNLLD
jgi:hypothetical protein